MIALVTDLAIFAALSPRDGAIESTTKTTPKKTAKTA
jgi:hypothetical protein